MGTATAVWVDRRLQATGRRPWRKVHLDFHNTPAVGAIGTDFDAAEFVATLRRGHVDAIVVFAKDMHGYFYYPAARTEAVHPGLSRDLMGKQIAACRAAGIRVYTILFQVDFERTKDVFRNCASKDDDGKPLYQYVPNASELGAAFAEIGEDLTKLAISR